MGGKAPIRCVSCGYMVGEISGRRCAQPKWHRPFRSQLSTEGRQQAQYWAEDVTKQLMGALPGWARARLYVEAMKAGKSSNQLAGELLTMWAKKQGGKP